MVDQHMFALRGDSRSLGGGGVLFAVYMTTIVCPELGGGGG
jgi:hypothetical protein